VKPRDAIRKFRLARGRRRTAHQAEPGKSFHEIPWRIARNGITYKRRFRRSESWNDN